MDDKELREIIKQYKLFDDPMMVACFDDKATIEEVLRIILNKPFVVKEISVQESSSPSQWHSARFDVLAMDENGKLCNIEVQQQDTKTLVKRASFYSALLVQSALKKGEDYDKLRETYVIFITETDIFNRKLPLYQIDRMFNDNKEIFNDGAHILFVNGAYINDDDDIGRFIHDMWQTDPNKMYNKILSDRMRIFKETDEEIDTMSELTQKVYNKGYNEGVSKQKAQDDIIIMQCNNYLKQRDDYIKQLEAKLQAYSNKTVS